MRKTKSKKVPSKRRRMLWLSVCSLLIAASLSVGASVQASLGIISVWTIVSFVIYFLAVFFLLSRTLFSSKKRLLYKTHAECSWKKCALFMVALLVLWCPIFLAYYPGIFGYDVHAQLVNETATSHHPLIHTAFINGIYRLGKIIGAFRY